MKTFTIAVIAGDGVGKEIVPHGKRILDAVARKHDVTFVFRDFEWAPTISSNGAGWDAGGARSTFCSRATQSFWGL
jgi:isocitrate/isopropylmalate dehydrogenase